MIDWNKYQAEALTTAVYPLERELDYAVLGLISEVGEVVENAVADNQDRRPIKTEIGDSFWYAAAVADALKTTLQEVWDNRTDDKASTHEFAPTGLVIQTGLMAGHLKKAIRDDAGVLLPARKATLMLALGSVLTELSALCVSLDTTVHAVTQANLNKLADRKQRGTLQGSGNHR